MLCHISPATATFVRVHFRTGGSPECQVKVSFLGLRQSAAKEVILPWPFSLISAPGRDTYHFSVSNESLQLLEPNATHIERHWAPAAGEA